MTRDEVNNPPNFMACLDCSNVLHAWSYFLIFNNHMLDTTLRFHSYAYALHISIGEGAQGKACVGTEPCAPEALRRRGVLPQ